MGETVELLIPDRLHEAHVKHRLGYQTNPSTRPMGERESLAGLLQKRYGVKAILPNYDQTPSL